MRCLALILLVFACPGDVLGWAAATHRLIAERASKQLKGSLGERVRANIEALLEGAVAPDRPGRRGWIPATDHVLHPRDPPRPGEGASGRVWRMVDVLSSLDRLDDAELAFELGRICHLVSDLCQPLHTDGGRMRARESEFHSIFERDVDRALLLASHPPGTVSPRLRAGPDLREHLMGVARRGLKRYDAIERAYLGLRGFAPVRELALRCVDEAASETLDVWRRLEDEAPGSSTPIGTWLMRYALVLTVCLRSRRPRRA